LFKELFICQFIVACVLPYPKFSNIRTVPPLYNGHLKCVYFGALKTDDRLMQDENNAESSY